MRLRLAQSLTEQTSLLCLVSHLSSHPLSSCDGSKAQVAPVEDLQVCVSRFLHCALLGLADGEDGRKRATERERRSRAGKVRTVLTEKQLNILKTCYR